MVGSLISPLTLPRWRFLQLKAKVLELEQLSRRMQMRCRRLLPAVAESARTPRMGKTVRMLCQCIRRWRSAYAECEW